MHLLMHSSQPLTVDDLSQLLSISRRSVYYALMNINEYLTANHQAEIQPTDEGIQVAETTRLYLKDALHDMITESYVHTPKERIGLMAMLLLTLDHHFSISDFEDTFKVSRNTVITDINSLKKQLKTFELNMQYIQDKGYVIDGKELTKRSFLLYTVSTFHYLIKINHFNMYSIDDYHAVLNKLKDIEIALNVHYVKETKEILAKMLAMIHKPHIQPVRLNQETLTMIEETPEYTRVTMVFSELDYHHEHHYITLHLLGLRVHAYEGLITKDNALIRDVVKTIIDSFKNFTLMTFDDESTLFDGLYYHMKSALIRYRYGIIYDNELKNDIKEHYPSIYNIANKVVKEVEALIKSPISEDDVAYIAMHFGGHLKRESKKINTKTILLVCLNGISTSKMLRKTLEDTLKNVTIIDAVSLDEVETYANQVDFIVTTIPIENNPYHEKTVMVQAIPSETDLKRLNALFSTSAQPNQINKFKRAFLSNIKREFKPKEYQLIKEIFEEQLAHYHKKIKPKERYEEAMLKDLLTKEHIMFKPQVSSVKEALYDGAKPLLDKQLIEKRYVEKVLKNLEEMGPYIVVAPNIALSHARPTDGVNELCMSLLLLEEPVNFSDKENREVRAIITLAAPDETSHLTALGQLSQMLMDASDELLNAKTKSDILRLIEQYSTSEEDKK